MPELITPWLILVTTSIGAIAAIGGGYYWVKRKLTGAFIDAVNDIIAPLVEVVERIEIEQGEVKEQLVKQSRERKREVDKQFVEVHTSIKMLEAKVTKSLETNS